MIYVCLKNSNVGAAVVSRSNFLRVEQKEQNSNMLDDWMVDSDAGGAPFPVVVVGRDGHMYGKSGTSGA